MKGWFTPTLSALALRQCLIMRSVSDNWASVASPLASADWPRVRHSAPLSSGWGDGNRHVFQWNRTPAGTSWGLSHCRSDNGRSERGWIDERRGPDVLWGVELVYSSVGVVGGGRQYNVLISCTAQGIQTHTKQMQLFCSLETDAPSCKTLIYKWIQSPLKLFYNHYVHHLGLHPSWGADTKAWMPGFSWVSLTS